MGPAVLPPTSQKDQPDPLECLDEEGHYDSVALGLLEDDLQLDGKSLQDSEVSPEAVTKRCKGPGSVL